MIQFVSPKEITHAKNAFMRHFSFLITERSEIPWAFYWKNKQVKEKTKKAKQRKQKQKTKNKKKNFITPR